MIRVLCTEGIIEGALKFRINWSIPADAKKPTDGNSRTTRLLLNYELMKNGYPPIIIKKEDRLKYYDALDTAHTTYNCTRH